MTDHEQLVAQLTLSAALIAASTFIQVVFVSAGAATARAAIRGRSRGFGRFLRDSVMLVLLALWLMVAHAISMGVWAITYLRLELFETLERALYFSAVSYTTLGFGDVLVPEEWGLLAGAQAATGLLMFGLSAALLVEAGVRLKLADPAP